MLVDKNAVLQVIGSLLKHPQYLSETEKYSLTTDDFTSSFEKVIFAAIYNLYLNGAEKITRVDIDNYLKDYPSSYETFTREKGLDYLNDAEILAQEDNFPYYYKRIKKFSCLRQLKKMGYDVSKIYNDNPLNIEAQKANEKFDSLEVSDIFTLLKKNLMQVESSFNSSESNETRTAISGLESLIENLQNEPEIGPKLQGDIFNTIVKGARKGKYYIRSMGTGVGKAIPNYTIVPTPNGYRRVDEIKVGDYLFDRLGNPTKVLGVYPQKEKKKIFKVYFKSGRIAECCDEHLWSYYKNKSYNNKLHISSLRELIDSGNLQDEKGVYKYSIPICKPINYLKKNFNIPPYVLGLILGDGSFRYTKNQKGFFFSSSDIELVESICSLMGYNRYKRNSDKNYSWTFESAFDNHRKVWVEDILKDYPELWNVKSEDKFIPDDYMFGDVEQRFDLLAGLLDTDGSIDDKGRIKFSNVSEKIINQVVELCDSLGITTSVAIDNRSHKYTTGKCFNIHISCDKETKNKLFKLTRKREKAINYFNNNKRVERRDRDSIIKIEETNNYADMTCFYVNNEEHLFLTNRCIVTHNTRSLVGDACNMAYPVRYNSSLGYWIKEGNSEKVLFVATEQNFDEIQTLILSYLTDINEDKIITGNCSDEEKDRIKKAIYIMNEYKDNFLITRMPNPDITQIKAIIRQNYLVHDIQNVFYDYIFSSPSLLSEFRDLKIREDICLMLLSTALKDLAVELNIFVMTATQLNAEAEEKKGIKNQSCIRGSRAVIDKADVACITARCTQDELNILDRLIMSIGKAPNQVTDIYKVRRGRWTEVRVWSYMDLGTCRKTDIFITDGNLNNVPDFEIQFTNVEFEQDFSKIKEVLNIVNDENFSIAAVGKESEKKKEWIDLI